MLISLLVFLFIFGLIVGSFLNVLIYRLEDKKRQTLKGRSFCPQCEKQIKWYDNIPVVSWLALRGRCRSCQKEISVQYPLVELATGFTFIFIGYFFLQNGFIDSGQARMTSVDMISLIFWFFFGACLIVIFAYDLKHQIIPDEIIYTVLIAGLFYVAINFAFLGDYKYLVDHILSGLLAGGFFYLLAAVSKGKWMGGGDIKLVAFMGLVLGWQGVLVALYTAFVLGAVVGVFVLATKQKKLSSKIPFGPFLVIGTFIGLLFSEQIIDFYVNMFL
jgi:prepilin signal peptidase PulO-like enzyme (type II secretory pathway)